MANALLLKFSDVNSSLSITRDTLSTLAKELGMTETKAIHFAVAKLAREILPAYEQDDGALSPEQRAWVTDIARGIMPRGKRLSKKSLL